MERLYEGLFLLDANEAAKSWSDMKGHIEGLLGRIDANVEYSERWSDKRLAYPVDGVTKGTYFLTYFRAPTLRIRELRRDAELSEKILRLLVVTEEWTEEEMGKRQSSAADRERRESDEAARAEAAAQEQAAKAAEQAAAKAAEQPEEPVAEQAEEPAAEEAPAPEAVEEATDSTTEGTEETAEVAANTETEEPKE